MAGKSVFLPGIPWDGPVRNSSPAPDELLSNTVPVDGDEGWDPHEEHRDYERLKAEYEAAKKELERLRGAKPAPAPAPAPQPARSWREAIIGAEILGKPKSKR